ncbi:MAG: hypothetical protein QM640_05975 [Niabella sp.]
MDAAGEYILKGMALWSYDHEILNAASWQKYSGQLGVSFHRHRGKIYLTDIAIVIDGANFLQIALSSLREIYLGCDEIYQPGYLKNFGLWTKPLRLQYYVGTAAVSQIYLMINQGIVNKNPIWYDAIVSMLS